MARVKDKIAIITGAAGGNGEGIARVLASEGAQVILTDIQDMVFDTAKDIKSSGLKATAFKMDVTNPMEVKTVTEKVINHYEKIDILVNNAGIARVMPFLEMPDTIRDKVMDVNFIGVWNCTKSILPIMVENQYGKIVNISSVTGPMVVDFGQTAYSASKSAVCGFTKALALEMAKKGITINAVLPGYVDTPLIRKQAGEFSSNNPQALVDEIANNIPMGRLGTIIEIGHLVAFLSSDESKYITGSFFVFDGGSTLPESGCALTKNL